MVKVKILKSIGRHRAGETVEVDEQTAENLCRTIQTHHGEELVSHVRAVRESDYEAHLEAMKNPANLDAAQAAELGVKNIVETPVDPAWEARKKELEAEAQKAAEDRAEKEEAAQKKKGKKK